MRNRRRIFDIIRQMEAQYIVKATEAGYLSGPNSQQMKSYLQAQIEEKLLMRELSALRDFELFVRGMAMLNKAYSIDLNKPKFMGKKLPLAVADVKSLMRERIAGQEIQPNLFWERNMMAKINERMQLFMKEKKTYSSARRINPRDE